MDFRILGLPSDHFADLFSLSPEDLAARGGVRQRADDSGRFPCRISLTDAEPGDDVILVNYEHLPVASPYRSRFAIYVRPGEQTYDAVNQVPAQLRTRVLAVRAFDEDGMMVGFELADGQDLETAIGNQFANDRAAFLHAHYAGPGCYAARIERA